MSLRSFCRRYRLSFFAVVVASTVLVSACSEDKSPPDDGKDGKNSFLKAWSGCDSRFRSCAENVLNNSGLARDEREQLASCKFADAKPSSSSEDLFEVARATVKAHCL